MHNHSIRPQKNLTVLHMRLYWGLSKAGNVILKNAVFFSAKDLFPQNSYIEALPYL